MTSAGHGELSDEHRRIVRHEMRTPVNYILSYAELVREDAEDQGLSSLVAEMKAVEDAGRTALRLVNAYLDARPVQGDAGPSSTRSELVDLMHEVTRRVTWIEKLSAVQAAPTIGTDLDRIRSAAQRLIALTGAE
jgi:signal transduction histidine kinase